MQPLTLCFCWEKRGEVEAVLCTISSNPLTLLFHPQHIQLSQNRESSSVSTGHYAMSVRYSKPLGGGGGTILPQKVAQKMFFVDILHVRRF